MVSSEPEHMPGLLRLYGRVASQGVLFPLMRRSGVTGSSDLGHSVASVDKVPVSGGRLARYRNACGFPPGEAVPPTYPHVLAFPLQLMVMTGQKFPFPALGAIHLSSRLVQERPLAVDDVLDLSVAATDLRLHRRGRQVTLVTEARVAREVVWRSENVFLHRESSTGPELAGNREEASEETRSEGTPLIAPGERRENAPVLWEVPTEQGRRYAAVSGDRNPIHLYDVTARPFGFPRHIAHGMWTMARALAQLADGPTERLRCEVAFKRPLCLPATVEFEAHGPAARIEFEVSSSRARRTTHLVGTLSRL